MHSKLYYFKQISNFSLNEVYNSSKIAFSNPQIKVPRNFEASSNFKNLFKKNIIINVFSDNIEKAESSFHFSDTIHFFKNNEDYIDLWSMSLCTHNILSNSTLSWWGAYINNNKDKIIVYPEDILRLVNATIYKDLQLIGRKTQHYKKEWIALKTKNVIFQ